MKYDYWTAEIDMPNSIPTNDRHSLRTIPGRNT